uniref:Ribosomal RNA processing protein 1 homolog n=1 Tax=Strongyloides papillosus TaxID=174720 RepID=A0A0N5C3X6_STREA
MDNFQVDQSLIEGLANSDSEIRSNSLEKLEEWIKIATKTKVISMETLKTISKGLYYALWMQDKALLHEDLCDRIVAIHDIFKRSEERVSYYYCLLLVVDQNILSIDKWRINKFLMLIRRIFRHIFTYIAKNNWTESICHEYIDMIDMNILNAENEKFSDITVSHIISLFMDEFDKALNIVPSTPEQQFMWYIPFLKVLENKAVSDFAFGKVVKEVFEAILTILEVEKNGESEIEKSNYKFPLTNISNSLFDIAKSDKINSKKRKTLYKLVERFKIMEKKYKE